jgi:hypothetical protein
MLYIDPNGNYPRYYGDIMSENSDWKLGDALPEGWQLVADTTAPDCTEDETFEDGEPQVIDGVLTRTFIVRQLTEEEVALRQAPVTARQKLFALGFTEAEISALVRGTV